MPKIANYKFLRKVGILETELRIAGGKKGYVI